MRRVILTLVLGLSAMVWAVGGNMGNGDGSEGNPYLIEDVNDFDRFADSNYAATYWAAGVHTKLMTDIDLSGRTYTTAVITTAFAGVFDGNGYAISRLTINTSTQDYVGFFYYSEGQIKNLTMETIDIEGDQYVGGLIGRNVGTVTNCYSTGLVSGFSYVGGLVGNNSNTISTITNSYSTCSVSGSSNIGGFVGSNSGTIESCYSTGAVNGINNIGGFIGDVGGTITNCYSLGSSSGTSYIGGFLGRRMSGTIMNCYSTGFVSGTDHVGGFGGFSSTITACFWDVETSGQATSAGGTGKTTVEMQTLSTFTSAGWDFDPTWIDGDPDIWMKFIDGTDYPKQIWQTQTQTSTNYSGGDGTAENPYQIANADDMKNLSNRSWHWGCYFILTADIDLSDIVCEIAPIAPDISIATYFQGTKFTGVFDGNGHLVSNLTISALDKEYIGLFGFVSPEGQIRNLKLENVNILGGSSVGGLVGWNDSDAITNCSCSGSVGGNYYVGGLVGQNYNGSIWGCYSTVSVNGANTSIGGLCGLNYYGTLNQSHASGTVSGQFSVGGLCGTNYATINDSYAVGPVTGTYYLGGLCGENGGTIINSYSTGTVTGGYYSGGLCGKNDFGTISQSYATGTVTGYNPRGGLCGYNARGIISQSYAIGEVLGSGEEAGGLCGRNESTIENSFWDTQTSGCSNSAGGWGMTTTEMQEMTYYSSNCWADTDWTLPENSYPRLAWEEAGGTVITNPEVIMAGSGTKEDPWLIATMADFVQFNSGTFFWNKHYRLITDIDMSGLSLNRIGYDSANTFTGDFDGNGHTISNLTQILSDTDYVGFFGFIGHGGQVQNMGLLNVNIIGHDHVGGLCGQNGGNIIRSYTTGTVEGNEFVGGLCGNHDSGIISQSHAAGTVTGNSSTGIVGGLCGENRGTIGQSYATGTVTGARLVGGLTGDNFSSLTNCYTTASVNGNYVTGGLAGSNAGSITNCYSTGLVTGTNFDVHGLVGNNEWGNIQSCFWDIETSGRADGGGGTGKTTAQMQTLSTFTSAGWDFVGESTNGLNDFWQLASNDYPRFTVPVWTLEGEGTDTNPYLISTPADLGKVWLKPSSCYVLENNLDLIGISWSTSVIQNFSGVFDGQGFVISHFTINQPISYNIALFGYIEADGQIRNLNILNADVRGDNNVGGICGYNDVKGTIRNSCVTGNVRAYSWSAGGLCGQNDGTICRSYTNATVRSDNQAGGVCGESGGVINDSYAIGLVLGGAYAGGLCGENGGTISQSYATGVVDGDNYTGGLCGYNRSGIINRSYAIGAVTGSDYIGGLVGYHSGAITNCYSNGSAGGSSYIGGLVGRSSGGIITNCYSTSSLSGSTKVGGLVGYKSSSTITASFWDTQTSGKTTSDGGTGKTTSQMQMQNTYASWDFVGESDNEVWRMCVDGIDYPRLSWQFARNGDFACGDGVDLLDLQSLADHWLMTEVNNPVLFNYACDANGDGEISFEDFSVLSQNW